MAIKAAEGEAEYRSLALVNTRLFRAGVPVDLLADTHQAGRWLGTPLSPAEADRLIQLRESIRTLFDARAADTTGAAPPPEALATVNAVAAATPVIPSLTWDDAGPRKQEQPQSGDQAASAMAAIAADAIDLLTSPVAAELQPCGAHGCVRWFLRTHAARQWCCTRCGDRVRAARHYARHRAGDNV